MNKHLFAFYQKDLSLFLATHIKTKLFVFKDAILWNRIVKILRLKPDDHIIIFDDMIQAYCQIHHEMFSQKRIVITQVLHTDKNKPLHPTITLYLPLLKKEALEHVMYIAAQMGINKIIPLYTEKAQGAWISESRLHQIMIAACEQAKQFVMPTLQQPEKLDPIIQTIRTDTDDIKICFDEHGLPLASLCTTLQQTKAQHYHVTFGPEGGFSQQENFMLKKTGFQCYRLTPTVLRSQEAATLGLGIIRSLVTSCEPQTFVF